MGVHSSATKDYRGRGGVTAAVARLGGEREHETTRGYLPIGCRLNSLINP